jgi:hypothetical protein
VCRQLGRQGADIRLQTARAGEADIVARDDTAFQIWGVVTQVIKSLPV